MSRLVDLTIAQPRNGGRTLQQSSQVRTPSSISNRLVMLPPERALTGWKMSVHFTLRRSTISSASFFIAAGGTQPSAPVSSPREGMQKFSRTESSIIIASASRSFGT